jgi:hypothetical protein
MKTNRMKKLILIMSKALRPEIANHPLARYAAKSLSKYIVIGVLCLTFAASAPAKLGETVPQLIKRFGKSYTVESVQIGKNYKFRSEKVSVDVVVADNISVGETYFSDHPLTASEEPPNDIVQGVLRTNVPKAKWVEIEAAPYRADYAIRSSDNGYIALLRYRGPQPEDATWTMTVARRENMEVEPREIGRAIPAAVAALPTSAAPSKSPVGNVNESPAQAASIAPASTPAASSIATDTATAALESAPAATPPPSAISWKEVDAIYNLRSHYTDLQKDEVWKRYKGQRVKWVGKVEEIKEGWLGGLSLMVKMNRSTFTFDLMIDLKREQKTAAMSIHKSAIIEFTGTLDQWGSLLPITVEDGEILRVKQS